MRTDVTAVGGFILVIGALILLSTISPLGSEKSAQPVLRKVLFGGIVEIIGFLALLTGLASPPAE